MFGCDWLTWSIFALGKSFPLRYSSWFLAGLALETWEVRFSRLLALTSRIWLPRAWWSWWLPLGLLSRQKVLLCSYGFTLRVNHVVHYQVNYQSQRRACLWNVCSNRVFPDKWVIASYKYKLSSRNVVLQVVKLYETEIQTFLASLQLTCNEYWIS